MASNDIIRRSQGVTLLEVIMEQNNWSVEELADKMGDAPLRLYKVLSGEEELGKTAHLAALALRNKLPPIDKF